METTQMKMKEAALICKVRNGDYWKCKNVSGDNGLQYCEKHFKHHKEFLEKSPSLPSKNKKRKIKEKEGVPPDEQRCRKHGIKWRCKNVRMWVDAEDGSKVPNTTYCRQHYNYYVDYLAKRAKEKKKKKKIEDKELPPDEQRCCHSSGKSWRCKNVRMRDDADEDDSNVPDTKYCRKHYTYFQQYNNRLKKTTIDGEGAGCSTTNFSNKRRRRRRRKKVVSEDDQFSDTFDADEVIEKIWTKRNEVMEYDLSIDQTGIQPATTADTIIPSIGTKRNKVTEDELVVDETGIQPATSDTSDKIIEVDASNIGIKRKNIERTVCSGEQESLTRARDPLVELERLEHYKSECVRLVVELEEKKAECTILQGKLAEVDSNMTAVADESKRTLVDLTECWRKMFSDLESRLILKMESTMECVESRISKVESLVLRSAKESSTLRCVELQNSEKTESEAWDSLNDVTQIGDKLRAETSSGGRKDSQVYEFKTKVNVPNVYDVGANKHHESESQFPKYCAINNEEGKGEGSSEERPSQHLLEMSEQPFVNLVSHGDGESSGKYFAEDSDSSTDSESSLGGLMEMMAMKYRNQNQDKEIEWKFEADMLSSLEDDPKLCMKAVCALYRQHISGYEISAKGLIHYNDVLRVTTLAKFLMGGDCKGDLKKSVKELETFDSEAVENCKILARRYSKQLFSIYQHRKHPYFVPATTSSHGDQTAK